MSRLSMPSRRRLRRAGLAAGILLPATGLIRPVRAVEVQYWICRETDCRWVYDPEYGDPEHGIPPGTRFEDLPDDWECPNCGADRSSFFRYRD